MSFGSFPLDALGLTPSQLAACKKADFSTAADILLPSTAELNKKLRVTNIQIVHDLVHAVSKAIVPAVSTVDQLLPEVDVGAEEGKTWWLGTGDDGLDNALGGGLRVGTLTEITGESAAGKSHLCMSLALAAQLPTLTNILGGAIILTSERELATARLVELSKPLLAAHDPTHSITVKQLLDNIHTNRTTDVEALDHALSFVLPVMLRSHSPRPSDRLPLMGETPTREQNETGSKKPIRLLILDSITALLRGSETSFTSSAAGLTQRSRYLCLISDKLKALAVEFELAVVVINQVTDVFSRPPPTQAHFTSIQSSSYSQFYGDGPEPPMLYSTQARWFSGQSSSLQKEASLGIVWANCVNVRVMLSRTGRRRMLNQRDLSVSKRHRRNQPEEGDGQTEEEIDDTAVQVDEDKPTLIRRLHVVFSPFAPTATLDYVITPSGVHSLPDSYKLADLTEAMKRRKAAAKAEAVLREQNGSQEGGFEVGGQGVVVVEEEEDYGEVFDDLGQLPAEFWDADGGVEGVRAEPLAVGSAL